MHAHETQKLTTEEMQTVNIIRETCILTEAAASWWLSLASCTVSEPKNKYP